MNYEIFTGTLKGEPLFANNKDYEFKDPERERFFELLETGLNSREARRKIKREGVY